MSLPIAIDYRPALLSRAGIGRATRELAKSLAAIEDVRLHLFGHSLARARVTCPPPPRARLHRAPIPGRALPLLRRIGVGADTLAGRAPLFHWTDYVQPPVRAAKTALTVHDLAFVRDPRWHGEEAGPLRERTAQAIAAATALITPTETTAADVRAFAPEAPTPRVIPWGADHVPEETLPRACDGDYALCVGTIEPRKNHLALLEAWRRLPPSRPQLVIIGAVGWECEDAVAALTRAEQDGVAVWRRDAGDLELWSLLQHARLLAYPALWEGFGFPPLEAMALGVPVVAHDTPALREVGDEGPCFADATDVDALTDALAAALFDEDARARHVRAGRKRARDFTWRRCAEQHRDLYREVCA
ncbi:MAG: glycosyltransferase family 1 protein [Planctomycetota bacterium]|nr:glycosyltransferase family 1 protein [Planctomycetota bacterium]